MPKQRITVKFYDAGPSVLARYTAVYLYDKTRTGGYGCVEMSVNPTHPQGFGSHYEGCLLGKHLGKRIRFVDLPLKCQLFVIRDLDMDGQVLYEGA